MTNDKKDDGSGSSSLITLVAAAVAVIVALGLVTYPNYNKGTEGNEEELTKLITYPQFRTEEQQADHVKQICDLKKKMSEEEYKGLSYSGCERDESGFVSLYQKVHNACCVSVSTFVTPFTAKNATDGKIVQVIQNFDGQYQYFQQEKCTNDHKCEKCNCRCKTMDKMYSAAITDGKGSIQWSMITWPGVCKCVNFGSKQQSIP